MKNSLIEESYKFTKKKIPLYCIIALVVLTFYTALVKPPSTDILVMGFGLGQWVFILLLTIASDFLVMEYNENTIITLFYKNSKKIDIFLAKFIVVTLYGILLLLIGAFFTFIINYLMPSNSFDWQDSYQVTHTLLSALGLNMLGLLLYIFFTVSLSFFLITLTKVNTLVIGIGLLIGFLGASISTAIMQNFPSIVPLFKWNPLNMIYIINQLPNNSYSDFSYLNNNQLIFGTIAYALLFFILGFILFKKRKI